MATSKGTTETVDLENAKVMAELIVDPQTSDHLRVTIINKLLESGGDTDFFPTIFEEKMSHGQCPLCNHENHWLIPEDVLNKMGWVTSQEDLEVVELTDEASCAKWQEACKKKKVTI